MATAATQAPVTWQDVIGPDTYAEHGYPHAAWKRLRHESPVAWFDPPSTQGFWAITKRADIVWLSKQPQRFRNGPRLAVFSEGGPPPDPEERVVRRRSRVGGGSIVPEDQVAGGIAYNNADGRPCGGCGDGVQRHREGRELRRLCPDSLERGKPAAGGYQGDKESRGDDEKHERERVHSADYRSW